MNPLKVINIFGGPCTGKSTNAAGVFYHMKCRGHSVELVTEYAKDMTWEKRHNVLADQTYILAKQSRRIARLEGEVQWAVTDGPFILGLLYTTPGYYRSFEALVMEKWERFNNTCFLLDRGDLAYDTVGRNQDLDGARRIDDALRELMDRRNIPYTLVPAGEGSVERILSHLNI